MNRTARQGMILLLSASWTAFAADPVTNDGSLQALRDELATLRRELAAAKLELNRTVAELKQLRQYTESEDPDEQTQQWRLEREQLEAERRAVQTDRIEAERTIRRRVADNRRGKQQREHDNDALVAARPNPVIEYDLSYIDSESGDDNVVVNLGNVLVPVETQRPIDNQHVQISGTLRNRSTEGWRYTFEIRLADRRGNVIGQKSYQTPVLEPHELHTFEVKVNVEDAAAVHRYQIGNIEADNPDAFE